MARYPTNGLGLAQANAIIAAALAKGRELGLLPLTVVVLDAGGQVKAMQREDGASLLRPEIAEGKALDITEDPTPRGHSFEFRLNGEDAGRGFLPAPGTVTRFVSPQGPGVRMDSGVESGSVIGGQFDSMLGKLIVTGEDRTQALERSRRALAELVDHR